MGKVLAPVEADTTDQKSFLCFLNRELLDDTSVASGANILLRVCPALAKKPQMREKWVFAEPHTAGWPSCPCRTYTHKRFGDDVSDVNHRRALIVSNYSLHK